MYDILMTFFLYYQEIFRFKHFVTETGLQYNQYPEPVFVFFLSMKEKWLDIKNDRFHIFFFFLVI